MKPEELRIGNFVHIKSKNADEDIPVQLLNIQDIQTKCELFEYTPIPLTGEWLIKFGFELKDEVNGGYCLKFNYNHREEYLYCSKLGTIAIVDDEENPFILKKQTKHVHQLQNLYFALTGEELTIKELVK